MSKRAEQRALERFPYVDYPFTPLDLSAYQRQGYIEGYEQAEKDLGWHSVEESLPPMDEEVIVLTDVTNGQCIKDSHRICFGHIVNPKYCDALECDGWNIPGVTHWMPCPKLEEEE